MKRHATMVIALSVLLPGCEGPYVADLTEASVPLTVNLRRLERVPYSNLGGDGNGTFLLYHHFLTPCEPYTASASGAVSESRIRFVVTAGPGTDCDPGMAGTFGYQVSVRQFATPQGNWKPVWAIHHYSDGRPSDSLSIQGAIPSPAPPPGSPVVTVRGRIDPADATIKPDQIVVYFEATAGDSSCMPGPFFRNGEDLGTAISDDGLYQTEISRRDGRGVVACVVAYGYRNWERVTLTPRATPVNFGTPDTAVTINMILPAGAGSWERAWRP